MNVRASPGNSVEVTVAVTVLFSSEDCTTLMKLPSDVPLLLTGLPDVSVPTML
jgi:hypothetical protein